MGINDLPPFRSAGVRKIDVHAKAPVVLPITSGGNFKRTAGFAVPLTGAGTKTTGVVRCDQPRALDLGAHGGRMLESVPAAIIDEVPARLTPIFE